MDRQPIVDTQEHNREATVKVRKDLGRMRTLDAETYMHKHPGMTFFWKEQNNGDVDRWLGLGAELVPENQAKVRQIKGYESRKGNTWVCRHVGKDQADNARIDYLMMMPDALYYQIKIAPERERNKQMSVELNQGRKTGEIDNEMRGNSELETYAPNLPTGGVGFETDTGPLSEDA